MIGGQPTKAMFERAESWCEEHGVDPAHAADLAEVFSLWAAEYEGRGRREALARQSGSGQEGDTVPD